jgi:hypothetical protein
MTPNQTLFGLLGSALSLGLAYTFGPWLLASLGELLHAVRVRLASWRRTRASRLKLRLERPFDLR